MNSIDYGRIWQAMLGPQRAAAAQAYKHSGMALPADLEEFRGDYKDPVPRRVTPEELEQKRLEAEEQKAKALAAQERRAEEARIAQALAMAAFPASPWERLTLEDRLRNGERISNELPPERPKSRKFARISELR